MRPLVQQREVGEQPLRIVGDLQKPLLEVALLDLDIRVPPAPSVDHLLVGKHRLVDRTPVDGRHRPVREAALEHEQEEPLRPLVVVGHAAGDLAVPVVEDPHHLEVALAPGDVVECPSLGMQAGVLHRRVFRRQTERVPAKWVQHLEALHPFHPRERVAHHVVARVAHVQVTRGIRIHDQVVVLRLRRVVRRLHDPALGPDLLPLRLDVLRDVNATAGTAGHRVQI